MNSVQRSASVFVQNSLLPHGASSSAFCCLGLVSIPSLNLWLLSEFSDLFSSLHFLLNFSPPIKSYDESCLLLHCMLCLMPSVVLTSRLERSCGSLFSALSHGSLIKCELIFSCGVYETFMSYILSLLIMPY